ncbi:WD40-repeat-containing domain protein [Gilbertella persicaria]|uniref:WD40-repeat-containing domain protein n=1 Tax=Gilbertella persicaria TaxID=101096 RepID=UPI00221EF23B|nr:WD40-repeat-containing domain protein [Gilbertella persicaria]KAI8074237.1 WD40-repeat-containing domain protein [Gilbertella persicaria]
MRSTPGVPLTIAEAQLSSPLPSPNRHSMNSSHSHSIHSHTHTNTTYNTYNTTSDLASPIASSSVTLVPLHFDPPRSLHSDLYPLATLPTPNAMRKFSFVVDEKVCIFEEVQISSRKRSASSWDDERSPKRRELDNTVESTPQTTFSPGPSYPASDIIPDSPNSALPSPVSDLDEPDWPTQQDHHEFIEAYDTLPPHIQTYLMFQLIKRTPRNLLRMANAAMMQTLKKDIIMSLPSSITTRILNYLDVRSLCRASGVSKAWKSLIDNASEVWKYKMVELDFIPSSTEKHTCTYKEIVRRHSIMRQNWKKNLHHKMLLEGHEEDLVTCLQFDDDKIITGSDDHSINVYDIKTGELKRVLKGHDGGVWALQYVGNTLVTGSIDRTVRVWDIERGICRFVLRGHSSTVRCLKIVMPTEIVHPDGSVTMEPSEPIIVSGSRDTTIRVWRLPDLENEPELPLSTCLEDDVISKKFIKYKLVEHEHSVRDLAVHGNTLVSGSYDNNVIVWDLETGRKVHILRGHTMKVYCVAIDPKRRHCISGGMDASVRIWGMDDGECKFILQGHAILVGLLNLADDCLVSAAADATLRTWNPANGDRLHIMAGSTGHQGPITSFQHDKYKVVSGSEGGVKMWDTQTGELLYDLIENVAGVWRVCFDERRCIAAVKNEHKTQLIVLDFGIHGLQ